VDRPVGDRLGRWLAAWTQPGDIYLPLTMVDSGNQVSSGSVAFATVYGDMVDTALDRPAAARMAVSGTQDGDLLHLDVQLANTSGTTLSAANDATLTALVYLENADPSALPEVLRAQVFPITTLADGATRNFTLEVLVNELDPTRIRWVVIADYRPGGSRGAYDTLQAVAGP